MTCMILILDILTVKENVVEIVFLNHLYILLLLFMSDVNLGVTHNM